ncbi:hypothetical protein [Nocardia sp. NPDC004860]|uniref:hypothetical protein n=1 Tax=Nocardia sp. NPDC004860 TaxID=3154557 RepID=UPI0033A18571
MEFVTAVAAQAAPGSAVATFAAQQARSLPASRDRGRLLSALLSVAFRDVAPDWLLKVAVDQALTGADEHWIGPDIDLAATALTHPDCEVNFRDDALQQCTDGQLANLGAACRPATLTAAVAVELRRRSPDPMPMTRQLLDQPTPAQKVLSTERLADLVFDVAFELLPTHPHPDRDDNADFESWHAHFRDRRSA